MVVTVVTWFLRGKNAQIPTSPAPFAASISSGAPGGWDDQQADGTDETVGTKARDTTDLGINQNDPKAGA